MKSILRACLVCVVFAGSAVALTGERMAPIPLDKMSAAQRKVAEDIMSGPRGGLRGPFNAWLRSPELADRLQKVGEYLRFNTSLDKRVNEMAIIMTAQAWGSQYEWYAHAPLAIKAGLDPAIVEAIGAGRKPEKMKEDEAIVWEFTTQLRRDHSVDDAIYARAVEKFRRTGRDGSDRRQRLLRRGVDDAERRARGAAGRRTDSVQAGRAVVPIASHHRHAAPMPA